MVSNGSGYDIACARAKTPIIYQNQKDGRLIKPIDFKPPFSENLYLVWLGNKKSTEQSIGWYLKHNRPSQIEIDSISELTEKISLESDFVLFIKMLSEHNFLMEKVLNVTSVQNQYFTDFDGVIKPLGAWGGDFVLVASEKPESEIRLYFESKGLTTLFKWHELVIDEIVD